MSLNTRGMISATNSGCATRGQSVNTLRESTREERTILALHDRTLQMSRGIRGIPEEIACRWYGYTRSESRYPEGHPLKTFRDFARAFARKGQSYTNVTAPIAEVCDELKRDFYRAQLPSLEATEQTVADDECRLQKAEITSNAEAVKEAARSIVADAELLAEVADRALHVTPPSALPGGTR